MWVGFLLSVMLPLHMCLCVLVHMSCVYTQVSRTLTRFSSLNTHLGKSLSTVCSYLPDLKASLWKVQRPLHGVLTADLGAVSVSLSLMYSKLQVASMEDYTAVDCFACISVCKHRCACLPELSSVPVQPHTPDCKCFSSTVLMAVPSKLRPVLSGRMWSVPASLSTESTSFQIAHHQRVCWAQLGATLCPHPTLHVSLVLKGGQSSLCAQSERAWKSTFYSSVLVSCRVYWMSSLMFVLTHHSHLVAKRGNYRTQVLKLQPFPMRGKSSKLYPLLLGSFNEENINSHLRPCTLWVVLVLLEHSYLNDNSGPCLCVS